MYQSNVNLFKPKYLSIILGEGIKDVTKLLVAHIISQSTEMIKGIR